MLSLVSTWMGDRLGTLGAVGFNPFAFASFSSAFFAQKFTTCPILLLQNFVWSLQLQIYLKMTLMTLLSLMTLGQIVLKYPRKNNDKEKLPTLDMLVFPHFLHKNSPYAQSFCCKFFMEFAASYLFETDYLRKIDNLLGHSDCSSSITT